MTPWPINLSNLSNISILDWVKIILDPKTNLGLDDEFAQEFQLYSLLICDQLWFFRNKARVEGSKSNPIELARLIRRVFESINKLRVNYQGDHQKIILGSPFQIAG